jgi:uncharacterized protein (DUF302 family)
MFLKAGAVWIQKRNRLSENMPKKRKDSIHDLQEKMRKNGKEVNPVKVIELCKPDYAYRLLSEDTLRIYSNMMPCRISVYEKEDGKTYVSRLNSAMLSSMIGGVVEDVMSQAYRDAESFIFYLIG